MPELLNECCERLVSIGVPVIRGHLTHPTLHPMVAAQSATWEREDGARTSNYHHGSNADDWIQSPLHHIVHNTLPHIRRRLEGPDELLDFPILSVLKERGATDYLGYAVPFAGRVDAASTDDGIVGSWVTNRPGGFSNGDFDALFRVQRALAVACKVLIREQITRTILTTYLGTDAGHQVLRGNIQRGDGERIRAIIWYSDMRNSTPLADRLSGPQFIDALNQYFECSAGAVIKHGGEVLRFIGDAVLGIFPVRDGRTEAPAQQALAAAVEAERRLVEVNARRRSNHEVEVDFGLALHIGEVMYGNIGVAERLEFSVTGPAANEVARMESLTKTLGQRVVISAALAGIAGAPLDSLGFHTLRGVATPQEVFGLKALPAPT
ncbi:MAG: adenylate/guanylate cyclase domain-containing protein [Pseudomonadota bacterium]